MVVELNNKLEKIAFYNYFLNIGYDINYTTIFSSNLFSINDLFRDINSIKSTRSHIHNFYDLNIPLVRFYTIKGSLYIQTFKFLHNLSTPNVKDSTYTKYSNDYKLIKKPIIINGKDNIELFKMKKGNGIMIKTNFKAITISSNGYGLTYVRKLINIWSENYERVNTLVFNKHLNLNNKINHDF